MKLAEGERLVKEWNVYSYGRGNRKTECSLILTNKRVISRERSKTKTTSGEFPLNSVRSWSVLSAHRSGMAWIIVGILLCVLLVGIPFGIPCIVHGVRLGRSGAFALSVYTRRRNSDFMQRGVRFLPSREERSKQKKNLPRWQKIVLIVCVLWLLPQFLVSFSLISFSASLSSNVEHGVISVMVEVLLIRMIMPILSLGILFLIFKRINKKKTRNTSKRRGHGKALKKLRINHAAAEEIFDQLGALIVENQKA